MELRGEETVTVELTGSLARDEARRLVPQRLALEEIGERAVVGLLLFQMRGLKLAGLPGPSFDYSEALWRIGVAEQGQPAWYAVACDVDHGAVRALGRLLIRYPTRAGVIRWTTPTTTVEVNGRVLQISADPADVDVAPVPARRAFVGDLYEVPWREDPAPYRRTAAIEVLDDGLALATVGAVTWQPTGLLHRGRIHRCGFARRA